MSRGLAMSPDLGLLCIMVVAILTVGHSNLQEAKEEVVKTVEDKLQTVEKTTKGLEDKLSKLHDKAKAKSPTAHETKLTSSESSAISAMVKSVNQLQTEMGQSGIAEGLLRSRLETLMEQSKAAKKSSTGTATPTCPPSGFNAVLPFSPEAYIKGAFKAEILDGCCTSLSLGPPFLNLKSNKCT